MLLSMRITWTMVRRGKSIMNLRVGGRGVGFFSALGGTMGTGALFIWRLWL